MKQAKLILFVTSGGVEDKKNKLTMYVGLFVNSVGLFPKKKDLHNKTNNSEVTFNSADGPKRLDKVINLHHIILHTDTSGFTHLMSHSE